MNKANSEALIHTLVAVARAINRLADIHDKMLDMQKATILILEQAKNTSKEMLDHMKQVSVSK